ncbi:MAG: type II toxin-antitoxin system HicB family antitoxin [Dehalococcoidia bacterium]|nr:type II toxin-antitoxin system HicB family antitoxin [Dehalococcoidia bacterium]
MRTYTFEVVIEADEFEDGRPAYHAYCPALPGCHTWGHTYEEAEANVREAVSLYMEDMIEAGEEVPGAGGLLET